MNMYIGNNYVVAAADTRRIRTITWFNDYGGSGGFDFGKTHTNLQESVEQFIDTHEYDGLTRIGTSLMKNILDPLVFAGRRPVNSRRVPHPLQPMTRPLLIVIITDGAVCRFFHLPLENVCKS